MQPPIDSRVVRIIILADLALAALLMLGSLGFWFIVGTARPAFIMASFGAGIAVVGQLIVSYLIEQLPGTIDTQSANAFERYFAQQARREQHLEQSKTPLIATLGVVVLIFVVGNTMLTQEVMGIEYALYAMWATGVFALVFYGVQIDDMLAAIPEPGQRATFTADDKEEEETPPWSM